MIPTTPETTRCDTALVDRLEQLAELLQSSLESAQGERFLGRIRHELRDLQAETESQGLELQSRSIGRIGLLTEVWECLSGDPSALASEVGHFCLKAVNQLADTAKVGDELEDVAAWILEQSTTSWGEYLSLLEAPVLAEPEDFSLSENLEPVDSIPSIDTQALLRLFTGSVGADEPTAEKPASPVKGPIAVLVPRAEAMARSPVLEHTVSTRSAFLIPELPTRLDLDDEIREAF